MEGNFEELKRLFDAECERLFIRSQAVE